jgi:hypothetical protein
MAGESRESDGGDSRAEPGEVARDAAADIGEAVVRVARAAGSVLDAFGQAAGDALSGLVGGAPRASAALVSGIVPEMPPLFPVTAGETVDTRVRLVNHSESASEPFDLAATDLVSDAGDGIPAQVASVPPGLRVVAAHQSDTISVTVSVPAETKPGIYRGELLPTDDKVTPAPLVVEVR